MPEEKPQSYYDERANKLKERLAEKRAQQPQNLHQHFKNKIQILEDEYVQLAETNNKLVKNIDRIKQAQKLDEKQIKFQAAFDIAKLEPKGMFSKIFESLKRIFIKTNIQSAQEKISQNSIEAIESLKRDTQNETSEIRSQVIAPVKKDSEKTSISENISEVKEQIKTLKSTVKSETVTNIKLPSIGGASKSLENEALHKAEQKDPQAKTHAKI